MDGRTELDRIRRRLGELMLPVLLAVMASPAHGDTPAVTSAGVDAELFVATIDCSVSCRGHAEENRSVTRTFSPREHGLRPGDGSDGNGAPWGGFTATLEAWSRFECLEAAAAGCRGLSAVERANSTRISSGTWHLDGRVLCPTPHQVRQIEKNDRDPRTVFPGYTPVLSPFQAGSGAIRTPAEVEDHPPTLPFPQLGEVLEGSRDNPTLRKVDTYEYWERRAVSLGEVPDSATTPSAVRHHLLAAAGVRSTEAYVDKMKRDNGIPPTSPCRHVIRGRACFGDCLIFPDGEDMVQYMATNRLGQENIGELAVCGDNLAAFLATHPMSDDARDAYCERYVTDSLIHGRSMAITCSSYRIRVDCSSLYP